MIEAKAQRRENEREREHQMREWMRLHGTDLETVQLRHNGEFGSPFLAHRNFAVRIALGRLNRR